jgi:hypothetical protein
MNCREFHEIVQELARARGIDAGTVKTGLAHAYACAPCAERLEEERSLAETLQRLAQSASTQEAPLGVEAALLSAFRQEHTAAHGVGLWRIAWAAGAAAAALAISFGLWHGWPSPKQESRITTTPVAVSAPAPAKASAESAAIASVREKPAPVAAPKRVVKKIVPVESPDEFAEGFVLLPYADTYGPLEAGEIVRVRLGSAALESLGLPVAGADTGQQVLADVLIGQDGLPRAVRFLN